MFHYFQVSKNVRVKRGWGYHNFRPKLFCVTVPILFVEDPSVFQKVSGIKKFLR